MTKMDERFPLALKEGTVLAGQYIIERVLGQGGFGITYVAKDHKSNSQVAIKEFFPDTMATRDGTTVMSFTGERAESYEYGKNCFLQEAQTLAQFIENDGIVRIYTYFEENNTAYFVMEYVEGESFEEYIKQSGGRIAYEEAVRILLPVMEALACVHEKGIVHRDVTPDNIFICNDGKVKLLDFGAARYSIGDKSKSLDVVLKHGFAPKEQYTRHGKQGAFTDVYSLGATFYYAITGKKLPDSIDRLEEDDMIPPSNLGVNIPEDKEEVLFKAISVQPQDRFQSMGDFIGALNGKPQEVGKTVAVMPGENMPVTEPVKVWETASGSAPVAVSSENVSTPKKDKKSQILPAIIVGGCVIVAAIVVGLIISLGGTKKNSDLEKPEETQVVKEDNPQSTTTGNGGSSGSGDDTTSGGDSANPGQTNPEPEEPAKPEYLTSIEDIGEFDAGAISNITNGGFAAEGANGTYLYLPGQGITLYSVDSNNEENCDMILPCADREIANINVIGNQILYTKDGIPYLMNADGTEDGICTNFPEGTVIQKLYANDTGAFIIQQKDKDDWSMGAVFYYMDWESGRTTEPVDAVVYSPITIFEHEVNFIGKDTDGDRCISAMAYSDATVRNTKKVIDPRMVQSPMGQDELVFFNDWNYLNIDADTHKEGYFAFYYGHSFNEQYLQNYDWNGWIFLERLGSNRSETYDSMDVMVTNAAYYDGRFFYGVKNMENGVDYTKNNYWEVFECAVPNMETGERKNTELFAGSPRTDETTQELMGIAFSSKYNRMFLKFTNGDLLSIDAG